MVMSSPDGPKDEEEKLIYHIKTILVETFVEVDIQTQHSREPFLIRQTLRKLIFLILISEKRLLLRQIL